MVVKRSTTTKISEYWRLGIKDCYNYCKHTTRGQKTVNGINKNSFGRKSARYKCEKDIDLKPWLIKDKLPSKPKTYYSLKPKNKTKEKVKK